MFRTIGTAVSALNVVNRHFESPLNSAGLRDIRWHDLRHTCATLLLGRRVHPKPVQYLPHSLGHASITVTLDRYSHRIASMRRQATDGIASILDLASAPFQVERDAVHAPPLPAGLTTPGWRYGNGKKRPGAKLWSVMTVSNIVRQPAYSGVHKVKTNGGKDVIEQPVPAVVEPGLQKLAIAVLEENNRHTDRKNERRYLLRGLVRCATCGGACTGHNSSSKGKKYHYYACRAAKTYNFGVAPLHKASFVNAEWLEELVWSDVRRFLEDPGEILELLREEQREAAGGAGELEARRKELAKRLSAKQAEKDRYVRAYAQEHISEEELDAYLAELKKRIDNLRVLLASVEAERSERRERTTLTDTTHAWLLSLGRRLAEVEEDTPEGFEKRKQLVGLLAASISLGKSQQEGRTEVQITYRFGPPPASDAGSDGLFMPHFKNGRRS